MNSRRRWNDTNAGAKRTCRVCGAELLNAADRYRHETEQHATPQGKRSAGEVIDEADRESFPASDAPSHSPVIGVGTPR